MKTAQLPHNISALVPSLANQIVAMIRREGFEAGYRLTEQRLVDELGVSRSPVRKALQFLETAGVVRSEPNKGFQVAKSFAELGALAVPEREDSDETLYMAIVEDRLAGKLGGEIAEVDLMQRYDANRQRIQRILHRMSREGMIERKPGRGWMFQYVLNTPESYRETYRFRMIIEPAALLEPGYSVNLAELDKCYREQMELLSGGIEKWARSELFRPGVHLHETIIEGAHNHLLLDALKKVNQLRRLVEYRSKFDHDHMTRQCTEHLTLIDLLRRGERMEASHFLREHLNGAKQRKAPD
ncbi:GntR family transcriptional regulator [Pollutimonas sp. M17]|uniref:GntR family transcriptional regulator n=1 Tax=Pollutimonas sp. M17 TaxID=2962065 RepID=UPI0021F41DDF|nr:GntR family transcriptional regulator [Pollutimonas sp. M17]UYO93141.1 GntR family transcriptional regulator [Pollutimonas sp. M17]